MMVLCNTAFGQTTAKDWFDKGADLSNQSKYDEAVRALDKAIEINPQYAEAWAKKGNAFAAQGKYNEALQASEKASR